MLTLLATLLGLLIFLLSLFAIAAAVVFVVRRVFASGGVAGIGGEDAAVALPYRKKDYLLTRAERSFYGALQAGVGSDYLTFPKVRLADLVWLPKGTARR